MSEHLTKKEAAVGGGVTEAWADMSKLAKDTKVNIPSEEAVEAAKEWVEENEK